MIDVSNHVFGFDLIASAKVLQIPQSCGMMDMEKNFFDKDVRFVSPFLSNKVKGVSGMGDTVLEIERKCPTSVQICSAMHQSEMTKEVKRVNEKEIIRLLQRRDESALSAVKAQYGQLCRQLALQILGNTEDAEECMNDTLLKLWNSIPPAEPQYLKAYLCTTLRNLALNRLEADRAAKRGGDQVPMVLEELAEVMHSDQDVAADVEGKLLVEYVRKFVRQLPNKQQRVFMQRYFYMMQMNEIAAENGMTENSVTVMLHRLRGKLHDAMRKEQYL